MIILYQFPISHYCEKVRWALDYKNLDYKIQNMLPGLHVKKAMSLCNNPEVPILKHDEHIVYNSSDIISYIDNTFEGKGLTPDDEDVNNQAHQWERLVDSELGPSIRLYFYNTLLKHPDILIPLFAHEGPWYGKYILRFIYPKLSRAMKRMMRINEQSAARAKIRVDELIDKLNEQMDDNAFLAGDNFSRADLAAASLLAPILQPAKYGMSWPEALPEPLAETVEEWNQRIPWVHQLYKNYR